MIDCNIKKRFHSINIIPIALSLPQGSIAIFIENTNNYIAASRRFRVFCPTNLKKNFFLKKIGKKSFKNFGYTWYLLVPVTETGTITPLRSAYKFDGVPESHFTSNSETYAMFATIVASSVVNVFEVTCGYSHDEQLTNASVATKQTTKKIVFPFILQ